MIDGGGVHAPEKRLCRLRVPGDDGLTVVGGVGGDVFHGLLHAGHQLDSQDIVQKFRIKVLVSGGSPGNDPGRAGVQPQLHLSQALGQTGQKFRGGGFVDQTDLRRVAHAGAAALGVLHDVQGHLQIRVLVHVDMADAGAGLNDRNRGVFHTGANQTRAASGNEQIHQSVGAHQLRGALAGGVLHQTQRVLGKARSGQAFL